MAAILKLVPHTEAPTGIETGYISPENLHTVLRKASTQLITFATLKALNRYRAHLYAINRGGIRRYRTIRDDEHMYGILILRLK